MNIDVYGGLSWNGFHLMGDEKSVKELRRILDCDKLAESRLTRIQEMQDTHRRMANEHGAHVYTLTNEIEALKREPHRVIASQYDDMCKERDELQADNVKQAAIIAEHCKEIAALRGRLQALRDMYDDLLPYRTALVNKIDRAIRVLQE